MFVKYDEGYSLIGWAKVVAYGNVNTAVIGTCNISDDNKPIFLLTSPFVLGVINIEKGTLDFAGMLLQSGTEVTTSAIKPGKLIFLIGSFFYGAFRDTSSSEMCIFKVTEGCGRYWHGFRILQMHQPLGHHALQRRHDLLRRRQLHHDSLLHDLHIQ